MDNIKELITILPTISIVFYAIINLIKSDPEKALEPYNIKTLKKILFEMLIALCISILMFYIPKIILVKNPSLDSFWAITPIGILIPLFLIFDEQSYITPIDNFVNKLSKTLKKNIRTLIFLSYLFSLFWWIFSLNNEMLLTVRSDLLNMFHEIPEFDNYFEMSELLNLKRDQVEFIKTVKIELFKLILLYNLAIYSMIRLSIDPFLKSFTKRFNYKNICTLKLKDGTMYRDYEFVSRDSKYIIIKKEKKYKAIFINQDEVIYIQLVTKK